jgi:hypothetical protein
LWSYQIHFICCQDAHYSWLLDVTRVDIEQILFLQFNQMFNKHWYLAMTWNTALESKRPLLCLATSSPTWIISFIINGMKFYGIDLFIDMHVRWMWLVQWSSSQRSISYQTCLVNYELNPNNMKRVMTFNDSKLPH